MINTSSLLRYAATFASLVMMVMMSCTDPSSEPTPSILQVSFSGDTLRSLRGTVDPTCRVTADWTICPDNDFQRYILYRAGWPGMYYNPSSAEVVGVFEGREDTLFMDNSVSWAETWFYAVRTENSSEAGSWSNEVDIVLPGEQPEPVFLAAWSESTGVCLEWSVCSSQDFTSNTLYRSETGLIASDTASADLLETFTVASDTSWTDQDAEPGTKYYYAMLTRSTLGLSVWSNEVAVIHNEHLDFPYQVIDVLATGWFVSDIIISWSGEYAVQPHSRRLPVQVIRVQNHGILFTLDTPTYVSGGCPLPSGNVVYMASVSEDIIYVADLDLEAIIDSVQMTVLPGGLCANPKGSFAYAASYYDHIVTVIDTDSHEVVDWVYTESDVNRVECHPSGEYIYALSETSNSITVIRTSDLEPVTVIDVGERPLDMCFHPDGTSFYVLCDGNSTIYEIDCQSYQIVDTFGTGSPIGLCILPSGDYLYITDSMNKRVYIYETVGNTHVLSVFIPDSSPNHIIASLDGQKVFVNTFDSLVILGY